MVYRTDTSYLKQDDKHSQIMAEIEKDRKAMREKLEIEEKARLEGNRLYAEKEAEKEAKEEAKQNSDLAKAEKAFKKYEANLYQQPVGVFK